MFCPHGAEKRYFQSKQQDDTFNQYREDRRQLIRYRQQWQTKLDPPIREITQAIMDLIKRLDNSLSQWDTYRHLNTLKKSFQEYKEKLAKTLGRHTKEFHKRQTNQHFDINQFRIRHESQLSIELRNFSEWILNFLNQRLSKYDIIELQRKQITPRIERLKEIIDQLWRQLISEELSIHTFPFTGDN